MNPIYLETNVHARQNEDRQGEFAYRVGRAAVRSLYAELALSPKPGLVSPMDNGAHRDMTMVTFMRSLFALRSYFREIALAGIDNAPFATLKALGVEAEQRMLNSTGGINTHRGAIFTLGLLAAAAGYRKARHLELGADKLCETVAALWGPVIFQTAPKAVSSNGQKALARYGGLGAREHAASGFPVIRFHALPALRAAMNDGLCQRKAWIQTLFSIMAVLDDTNLLHRGGQAGLDFVRRESETFLAAGGVRSANWQRDALKLHAACIERQLSPGGAADLLAASIFLSDLETGQ